MKGTVGTNPEFLDEITRLRDKLEDLICQQGVRSDDCLAEILEDDFTMGELRTIHQALLRFSTAFCEPAKAA